MAFCARLAQERHAAPPSSTIEGRDHVRQGRRRLEDRRQSTITVQRRRPGDRPGDVQDARRGREGQLPGARSRSRATWSWWSTRRSSRFLVTHIGRLGSSRPVVRSRACRPGGPRASRERAARARRWAGVRARSARIRRPRSIRALAGGIAPERAAGRSTGARGAPCTRRAARMHAVVAGRFYGGAVPRSAAARRRVVARNRRLAPPRPSRRAQRRGGAPRQRRWTSVRRRSASRSSGCGAGWRS